MQRKSTRCLQPWDRQLQGWFCNSFLVISMYYTFVSLQEAVHKINSSTDNSLRVSEIETKLYDLRQGDLSVTQYFTSSNVVGRNWTCTRLIIGDVLMSDDSALNIGKLLNKREHSDSTQVPLKTQMKLGGEAWGCHPFLSLGRPSHKLGERKSRKKLMITLLCLMLTALIYQQHLEGYPRV